MTSRARKILEEALNLPADERSDLVAELLATLDPERAEELHPSWMAELERRAREAHAQPDGGEPWEVVEARLLARLPG